MVKRQEQRYTVRIALAVVLACVFAGMGCSSDAGLLGGDASGEVQEAAARQEPAPTPGGLTSWGLAPDINDGVEEWAEFIGAVPVDSAESVRDEVVFEVAVPDQLGGTSRSHLFVTKTGGASTKVVDVDGTSRSYSPPPPAKEQRVMYAFYGDVGLYAGPSGWPVTADAARVANDFVEGQLSGTGMRETRSVLSVNGIPAVGWSKGTYPVRSEDSESQTGFDVVYTNSVVTWIQNGVQLSVSSFSRTHDELLPFAAEVARAYEAR